MPWPVKRVTQRTAVVHVIARAAPLQFTSVVLTESAARPALHEGHEEGVCGERAQCVPSRCGFLTHEHVLGRPWYTPQRSHKRLQMPDGHPPRQTQRHARVPGHEQHVHSHTLHATKRLRNIRSRHEYAAVHACVVLAIDRANIRSPKQVSGGVRLQHHRHPLLAEGARSIIEFRTTWQASSEVATRDEHGVDGAIEADDAHLLIRFVFFLRRLF